MASIRGSFPSDTKLKWSIAAHKSASSLSVNLQLLCFMGRVWCYGVDPSDMFVLGMFNIPLYTFKSVPWM